MKEEAVQREREGDLQKVAEITYGKIPELERSARDAQEKLGELQKQGSLLKEELGRRVVSQRQAIDAVSRAVRRNLAGIGEENRPIGSFIFLGPTGVGKTELAKAHADVFNILLQTKARLAQKGITLTVTKEAKDYLAREGYDEVYGARPLRRVIQNEIWTSCQQKLLMVQSGKETWWKRIVGMKK